MLRRWRVLMAIAAVYLYAFPYFAALRHANELPRILTTEQLVERGTFRLDERLPDLGSLADVSTTPDGHRYQNKAPGLSILGVVPYAPLAAAFHFAGRRPPLMLVTWTLRVVLATLPTLALVACFSSVARRFADTEVARDGALVAFALGSMALPLGILFMSHAVAAALVGIAFALAMATVRHGVAREVRPAVLVGALLGVSMLCEYQAIFAAAVISAYLVAGAVRRTRVAVAIAIGSLPSIAALAWYHWSAFGSPLRTGYAYSVDAANRLGFMGIVGFSRLSVEQLFVRPDNGLLLLSPWVVLAGVGAVNILRCPDLRARVGREALAATAIVVTYCAFVASLHPEFGRGGWSVGPRYIAVAMPFVAWLAAAGLDLCLRHGTSRVAAFSLILAGVAVHVIAASTYPHWPIEFQNPLFEVSIRMLREGHAPHSLGTLAGLHGFASVAPLYVMALTLTIALLAPSRRYLTDVVIAAVIAAAVVASYARLGSTDVTAGESMWQYVKSTFEP